MYYDGKKLAKVLIHYGIIQGADNSEFNVICPFHGDINPSMRINLSEGTYFCFGCGVSGNALDFVKAAENIEDDLSAAIMLEKILNSNELKKLNIRIHKKRKRNLRRELLKAEDYYYGLKKVDWTNKLTEEQQKIADYMKQRGFTRTDLNIAQCRENYSVAYPFIFPILDNGNFKGWVARTDKKAVERKRKYLYNEGFSKRTTLCGNYSDGCIPVLCEGFMDYLTIRTKGKVDDVAALLGWHISDEQTNKLKQKGVTTVISALDNDSKGMQGTEYLKKFFHVVRFQYPEGCKDANDMTGKQIRKEMKRIHGIIS